MTSYTEAIKKFLTEIIAKHLTADAIIAIEKIIAENFSLESERSFYLTFSKVPRITGKSLLALSENDLNQAQHIIDGFNIKNWTVDRASRVLIILSLVFDNNQKTEKMLDKMFSFADAEELVALYSSFALLPFPDYFIERAAEGIRNNMTLVFDAIALNNPYPALYLSESAWNQLVLKAVFNNRPLNHIYNIDLRANINLAQMLSSFAHERWAAGRSVTPELWRCVGPFIDDKIFPDLIKTISSSNALEQQAGALACASSTHKGALELLNGKPALIKQIQQQTISWQSIANSLYSN